jgi:hypothetical protein
MSFEDYQEHGECERCGKSCRTNGNVTMGFGMPVFACNGCTREFILYGQTTKEVKDWEAARAAEAAYKLMMKNPLAWANGNIKGLDELHAKYRESHVATERAMAAVNVLAAKFLANKLP